MKNNVIAERLLYLPGDPTAKVHIQILQPVLKNNSHYDCDYIVKNLESGKRKSLAAGGADSVQALLIALAIVGKEIEQLNSSQFSLQLVHSPDAKAPSEDNCGFPFYDVKSNRTIFLP